jgi:hypothetical protein
VRPENLDEVKMLEAYIQFAESSDADPGELAKRREEVRGVFTDDDPAIELTDMAIEQRRLLGELNLKLPVIPAPDDEDEPEEGKKGQE